MDGESYMDDSYAFRGRRGRGRGASFHVGRGRGRGMYSMQKDDERDTESPKTIQPMILTKPQSTSSLSGSTSAATAATTSSTSADAPMYPRSHQTSQQTEGSSGDTRTTPVRAMSQSAYIVNPLYKWCDSPVEYLQEQVDFLTIGVLGIQGAGKSTLMSLLGGAKLSSDFKTWPFSAQNRELKERCSHRTEGVDMYVTSERVILLDTQPVLCSSVIDQFILDDRKYPTDFNSIESYIEIQSLQLAAFLTCVCHVILVVCDREIDIGLLRFLRTAEMLRSTTPAGSDSTPSAGNSEHTPHLVFVMNKVDGTQCSYDQVKAREQLIKAFFRGSKLKAQGSLSQDSNEMNITYIPHLRATQDDKNILPGSGEEMFSNLHHQLLSVSRPPLTSSTTPLTEKHWFHYAARMWETTQRSQMFSEFNRLIS